MNSVENTARIDVPLQESVRTAMQGLWTRCYFKFILPRITGTEIDGIKLDLSALSPKVRNRILMGYEEAEKTLCRQLLRKNDVVLELGGGIGFIGLFCQKRLGIKSYVTVEANPHTITLLKQNYRLNGLTPRVLNYALSDTCGPVQLNISGDFWEHNLDEQANTETLLTVPGITFTDLLKNLPIQPNTLIIDVEGAERFIDFREIPEEIKKIIVEIHPVIVGPSVVQEVISALHDARLHVTCEKGGSLAFTKEF